MAEAVGAIASVIGIAACGVKLSRVLYQMTTKTVHAQDQLNKVAMNTSLFSSTLSHLGRVLKETDVLQTDDLLFTVRQVVDRCQVLFDEITRLATLSNKGEKERTFDEQKMRKRMLQRVKFYFTKPTVEHLLAELEYLKTTLSVILNTLNLAALAATHKQNQALLAASKHVKVEAQNAEHNARVQVETLIVARQIAFVVLNQIIQTNGNPESPTDLQKKPGLSSQEIDDFAIETPSTKLLMDQPANSMSLVKLDTNELAFLDSGDSEPDQSMLPFMNAAPAYVDKLLNRWTRVHEIPAPDEYVKPQTWEHPTEVPQARAATPPPEPNTSRKRPSPPSHQSEPSDASWDVVQIPDLSDGSSPPPPPPPPPTQSVRQIKNVLDPTQVAAPRLISAKLAPPIITSPFQSTGLASLGPRILPPLMRTHSVPESDLPIDQPMVHYRQDEHPPPPQVAGNRDLAMRYQNVTAPLKSPTGDDRSPSNVHFYALPWYLPVPPGSNYRKPFVDSDEESDYSDHGGLPRRSASFGSRRRSGTFSSTEPPEMDIPWRIRISGSKFFEFIDDKLVGPRTPDLPTERMSWVYSHTKACTEISKSWVTEAAIKERKYRYVSLPREDMRAADNGDGWRILQPLHFDDIQALVDRTADMFPSSPTQAERNPSSPQAVPQAVPLQQRSSLRPPSGSLAPGSPRSVSFNGDLPPRDGLRSPRDSYATEPSARRSPQPQSRPPPPRAYPPPPTLRGAPSVDNERAIRDRNHSPEDDREAHRRREDRRRRQEDERTKRKRRHRNLGTTMAKIGGLAALLDGLDGAF